MALESALERETPPKKIAETRNTTPKHHTDKYSERETPHRKI
jgi:hypothetical protein